MKMSFTLSTGFHTCCWKSTSNTIVFCAWFAVSIFSIFYTLIFRTLKMNTHFYISAIIIKSIIVIVEILDTHNTIWFITSSTIWEFVWTFSTILKSSIIKLSCCTCCITISGRTTSFGICTNSIIPKIHNLIEFITIHASYCISL